MNIRASAFIFCSLGLFAACESFNKATSQATSRHVMVSTLVGTPAFTISPAALAGFDASVPAFDAGGFVFDAGRFDAGALPSLTDAGLEVPAQTGALVFFGQLSSTDLSQAPMAVVGATATLTPEGGAPFTLKDSGNGSHQLSSQDDASLHYQPNTTWTFTCTAEGQTYVADVQNTPDVEHIAAFHPAAGFLDLPANGSFTFVRPDPDTGSERNLGFVTVVPISVQGGQGTPTFTTIPQTPLEFLKLAAAPGDWKTTTVVIPGSAFPEANHNYVIVLQSARLGGAKSENLFIGSAVIAGTAEVAVVKTH